MGPQTAGKEEEDYERERSVQGQQTASGTDGSYHHTYTKKLLNAPQKNCLSGLRNNSVI